MGKGGAGYINDYYTSASVGAELLQKAGIQREAIQMVPSHVNGRERTYSSAIALRDWFREHKTLVSSINVLTEGAHARRTRLLYQKAVGRNLTVGIIAVSNPDYNPIQWWRYSDGVREVIGESIVYIYPKFFFIRPRRCPTKSRRKRSGISLICLGLGCRAREILPQSDSSPRRPRL